MSPNLPREGGNPGIPDYKMHAGSFSCMHQTVNKPLISIGIRGLSDKEKKAKEKSKEKTP